MGDKTGISWTNATWNPIVGCSVISPGCKNCYAMREAARLEKLGMAKYAGLTTLVKGKPVFNGVVRLAPEALDQPIRWKRPRSIFVNSMSDLGHEALDRADVFQVLEVIERANWHVFQALTKRPQVLCEHLCAYDPVLDLGRYPSHMAFKHVWWGVSVEDQARANERLESARRMDALGYRVWVSYEPSIGAVNWTGWEFLAGMVSGGESGAGARPSHPDWHRTTRDWCAKHGIPYDFKQWGNWRPALTVEEATNYPTIVSNREAAGDSELVRRHRPASGCFHQAHSVAAMLDGSGEFAHLDCAMYRAGKRASGRLLDGQLHDGFTRACAPAGRA